MQEFMRVESFRCQQKRNMVNFPCLCSYTDGQTNISISESIEVDPQKIEVKKQLKYANFSFLHLSFTRNYYRKKGMC